MQHEVQKLLDKYYHGPYGANRFGVLITCPFHADSDPSCVVYPSGVFKCWVCNPGSGEAVSPFVGFKKLGASQSELDRAFGRKKEQALDLEILPALDQLYQEEVVEESVLGVESREEWPKFWNFRGLEWTFLRGAQMQELFNPTLVRLWVKGKNKKKYLERLPRLALRLTGAEDKEVYLRLSSEQNIKVRNSHNLDLKNAKIVPFGLKQYKIPTHVKSLLLLEGPYDLLQTSAHLQRMKLEHILPIALLGTAQWTGSLCTKFENQLLPQFNLRDDLSLYLGFDDDLAGRKLTKRIFNQNDDHMWLPMNRLNVFDCYPFSDPGELSFNKFQELIKEQKL